MERNLGLTGWEIRKPMAGLSKETFIAKHGQSEVFVKLDAPVPYLKRLSELEITPKLLASGEENTVSYAIQELASGTHPTPVWFRNSLSELAMLINRYHDDKILEQLLKVDGRLSTAEGQINSLEKESDKLLDPSMRNACRALIDKLKGQTAKIRTLTLAPVHPDPNTKNWLVGESSIRLIDWDDIVLSDPVRDVGLICYWYLPQDLWLNLLEKVGIEYNDSSLERLYWWVTARSLAICLWFSSRNQEHEALGYLEDAQAAIAQRGNPHPSY